MVSNEKDDKSHQDNKKNIPFVRHRLTYGLSAIIFCFIITIILSLYLFEQRKIKTIKDLYNETEYNNFVKINDMKKHRALHKSFLLDDGNVLIIGGTAKGIEKYNHNNFTFKFLKQNFPPINKFKNNLQLSENLLLVNDEYIFNVKNNTCEKIQGLISSKYSTSILLNSNEVLIINPDKIFIYNIINKNLREYQKTNKLPLIFTNIPFLNMDSANSKILISGIEKDNNYALYIWDVQEKSFTKVQTAINNPKYITFIKNRNNDFIIFESDGITRTRSYLLNINTLNKKDISNPIIKRINKVSLLKLRNGEIFITGGDKNNNNLMSAEIYNPQTDKYQFIGYLQKKFNFSSCNKSSFSISELHNGDILICGGSAEVMELQPQKTCVILKRKK